MTENFKKVKRNIFRIFVCGFAIIGFIFSAVFVSMQFGWLNVRGSASERNSYFDINKKNNAKNFYEQSKVDLNQEGWQGSAEWGLLKEVFTRDQDIIKKAASDAGISPRLIISGVIGEQFRFFGSRRESFKTYFEPLKILASLSKISYGIAGLKPKTVGIIEDNLKNKNSPFYLGTEMENVVDYLPGIDIEKERMNRITDAKNPYYSYLYVGLFMREIISQWRRSGFDISNRPEILATLYNLGFYYSVPKENPLAGGSVINVNGKDYTFGDMAYEFYYSGELSDIYPIEVQ
jgi:hypothetical protein